MAKQMHSFEPMPTNERARDQDIPSGLKNVGNSKSFLFDFIFIWM